MPSPLFKLTPSGYFKARTSVVTGDVKIGADSSLWFNAVLRGDVAAITIGRRVNVQDNAVVHCDSGVPNVIEDDVTIGHGAIVHACVIEDACLIGMGSTVLDGAVVKKHGFVGAGAVLSPGKVVGEAELWLGNPARFVRKLSDKDIEQLYYSAKHYVKLKDAYL